MLEVAARSHGDRRGGRDLVPVAGQVVHRLGDDQAVAVELRRWARSLSGCRRFTVAASADTNSERGCPRRRVAHSPERLAVADADARPGPASASPWRAGDRLDRAERLLEGADRIRLQAERQSEVEDDLRVRRALDVGEERRVDEEHEVASQGAEVADDAVVHEQPRPVAERMAVPLLDRRPRRRADVRQEQRRLDVPARDGAGSRPPTPAPRCGTRPARHRSRTTPTRSRRRSSSRPPVASAGSGR